MQFHTLARYGRRFGAVAAVAAMSCAVSAAYPAQAADAGWPTSVAAKYKLSFGGFEVGKYHFESKSDGKAYTTSGNANISALFGAFTWKGDITSSGALSAAAPQPSAYKLNFKSKSKVGAIALGFDKGAVKSVTVLPTKPPHPDAVPVTDEHKKNVFDPMSSILAMTHAGAGNPCDRTIPIFDGKVRFNLVLSAKGEKRLANDKSTAAPKELKVCKVKYVPLAGHKPKDFANPWVDYGGMEIALRPVPAANLYVPYSVTIPTSLGAAEMTAETIQIKAANNTEIALSQ